MKHYWRSTNTYYCHDLKCSGSDGFTVREHPATMVDPPWLESDVCPVCGDGIHEAPLEWENPIATLVDDLGVAAPIPSDRIDHHALAVAVQVELRRQASEWYRARVAEREAASTSTPNDITIPF